MPTNLSDIVGYHSYFFFFFLLSDFSLLTFFFLYFLGIFLYLFSIFLFFPGLLPLSLSESQQETALSRHKRQKRDSGSLDFADGIDELRFAKKVSSAIRKIRFR